MKRLFAALSLCILSSTALAESGRFYLLPSFGGSDVNLKEGYELLVTNSDDDKDGAYAGLALGYQVHDKVDVELNYNITGSSIINLGLSDFLELQQVQVAAVYKIDLGGWQIRPRLAISQWKLDVDRPSYLNRDGYTEEGTDLHFELGAGYMFGFDLGILLQYSYLDFGVGDMETLSVGLYFPL